MIFSKLYDYEDGTQILVKNDSNDKGDPEVRFFFTPEGLGVCSVAVSFDDTDQGYAKCDYLFEEVTKESALVSVGEVLHKFIGV